MAPSQSSTYGCLAYKNPDVALSFLKRAFGFREGSVYKAEDGTVMHAELQFGNSTVMLGPSKEGRKSPAEAGGIFQEMFVYLEDQEILQAHFNLAKSEGADIVSEPKATDWGSFSYTAKDPEGNVWYFATYHPAKDTIDGVVLQASLFPYLFYKDVKASMKWLENAFGFQTVCLIENNGAVRHAEVQLGNGAVMLGPAHSSTVDGTSHERKEPKDLDVKGMIYTYVKDLHAHYEHAKQAGVEMDRELAKMDYGAEEYSAKDPAGYVWSFGTYQAEVKA